MTKREFNNRIDKMVAHAPGPATDRVVGKIKETFEAIRTELDATVGTPNWKDGIASAAGVSLCDLAERLASDLKA